jgi:hypothetical protein
VGLRSAVRGYMAAGALRPAGRFVCSHPMAEASAISSVEDGVWQSGSLRRELVAAMLAARKRMVVPALAAQPGLASGRPLRRPVARPRRRAGRMG